MERPSTAVEVVPLTPDRWDDLAALFGRAGADAGCWCMYFRMTGGEWSRTSSLERRARLRERCQVQPAPGLLAYLDGRPAGWIGLGPRSEFARLARSKTRPALDDVPVWSVVCFFVARWARGRDIPGALLRAAADYAPAHGAPALEAYPVAPGRSLSDARDLYPGTPAVFAKAGFQTVAETTHPSASGRRFVVRRTLP